MASPWGKKMNEYQRPVRATYNQIFELPLQGVVKMDHMSIPMMLPWAELICPFRAILLQKKYQSAT